MDTNEKTNNDIQKIIKWAESMKNRGMYKSSTVSNRIKALKDITSVLATDEPKDAKSILEGLDSIVDRWAIKTSPSPTSVSTTKSHARGLLIDYTNYQKDPAGFKPHSRAAEPKKAKEKKKVRSPLKGKAEATVVETQTPEIHAVPERPSININVQIHISADASEKQIDKIFESMSRHIYSKKK